MIAPLSGLLLALVLSASDVGPTHLGGGGPRIVDEAGRPVAVAFVEAYAPPAVDSPLALFTSALWSGESGPDGRLPQSLPKVDDLLVVVDHPSYASLVHEGPVGGNLVLESGARLSGRLRDDNGKLVERARVCATWETRFPALRWTREWRRCTDEVAGGSFEIGGLSRSTVRIEVRAPGFLPLLRSVENDRGEPIDLSLERGILVRGLVIDGLRRPVEAAEVAAGDAVESTDSGGGFQIGVSGFPVLVEVSAPGHRRWHETLTSLPDDGLLVVLEPGQQVRGRLLSAAGDELAEGALWTERQDAPGRRISENLALDLGEDGGFEVELKEPGRYQLAIGAAGHRPFRLAETVVEAGGVLDLGILVLEAGSGVTGSIVDADTGLGLEGAAVRLRPLGSGIVESMGRGALPVAVSEVSGQFAISGLEAGRYELRVSYADRAERLDEVELAQDERVDLGALVLGSGVRLVGRVVDRAGDGQEGVVVELSSPSGQSFEPLAVATTLTGGRIEGLRVQPGRYRFRLHRGGLSSSRELLVPEGREEHEVELVLAGVRLSILLRRGGVAVSGGRVVLSSDLDPGWRRGAVILRTGGGLDPGHVASGMPSSRFEARVDARGVCEIDDAPPGPVALTYYGEGGETSTKRLVLADSADASVVVDLGESKLFGAVVDAATSTPVPAHLHLFDASGRMVDSAATGSNGEFAFDGLEQRSYRLDVSARGYRSQTIDAALPGVEPLSLALEPAASGSFDVRLRRADGSPAGRVQVTVLSAGGHVVRSLLTDSLGARRFTDVAAGTYFVVWTDPVTGTGVEGPVVVGEEDGGQVERWLSMGSSVVLHCAVGECAHESVDGLSLFDSTGVEISAYLPLVEQRLHFSAEGQLPLGRLAPGSYLLRLWRRGRVTERRLEVVGEGLLRVAVSDVSQGF